MSSNAALALADSPATSSFATVGGATTTVVSDVLGTLAVPADAILTFPTGLLGFPECRRFAVVPAGREGLFWLQSLEHATLAFLLVDPFPHFTGYTVELGAADRGELHVSSTADVAVLAVVTLPHARDAQPTANLQGPLALNLREGLGRQLALADGDWGVRCAFEP